ncbi:hypothetical protein V6Z12_D05G149900 [Gossypium hirsutum]
MFLWKTKVLLYLWTQQLQANATDRQDCASTSPCRVNIFTEILGAPPRMYPLLRESEN